MNKNVTKKTLVGITNKTSEIFSIFKGRIDGLFPPRIHYIVEKANWSIRNDGECIINSILNKHPNLPCEITDKFKNKNKQVIHFGSFWMFHHGIKYINQKNVIITTIFHGYEGLNKELDECFCTLKKNTQRIFAIITPNNQMAERLENIGIEKSKIYIIPLGVDLNVFSQCSEEAKQKKRQAIGIRDDQICIGSFQKDGDGWGEGLSPKLIKGPDIFVDAVIELSKNHPVFVLLTGPSRGYVIKRLEEANIPYHHTFFDNYEDIAPYYNCLDIYIVSSREEGGPKSILESMASGVPLVTTSVGMALDIVTNGHNAILTPIENTSEIIKGCEKIINNRELRQRLIENGLETVKSYRWSDIGLRYYDKIYKPALEKLASRTEQ